MGDVRYTVFWFAAIAVLACGAPPITDCVEAAGVRPVCGFHNPEDLAPLGDGRRLIVSQFGGGSMDGSATGNLVLFDTADESLRILFPPPASAAAQSAAGDDWGDPSCPGPTDAAFSPHGMDLAHRADGALSLLVVNHGGREAVEMFEVTGTNADVAVHWRGCAAAPEGALLNDVVHLPGGGFAVTRMMDKDAQISGMLRSMLGMETGRVYEWQPATGLRALPGSEGAMPNGIEVSPDGRGLYSTRYGAGEVRRVGRPGGALLGSAPVKQPDNSTWAPDGRLLVASHTGGLGEQMACMRHEPGTACSLAFEIVALDPDTLEKQVVFAHEGPPMGAATVAVELGGELWMGSFASDRLIRARPTP
jgi:sugar lactone lactonase YvrE